MPILVSGLTTCRPGFCGRVIVKLSFESLNITIIRSNKYNYGKLPDLAVATLLKVKKEGSYEIIKKYRNGLNALFWQKLAKLYDGNLKITYQPEEVQEDLWIADILRKKYQKSQKLDR